MSIANHPFCIIVPLCIIFGSLQTAEAAHPDLVVIKPSGTTQLTAFFGQDRVSVTVITQTLDIGNIYEPPPVAPLNNCTYSRYPCSLVDRIDFTVNGNPVIAGRDVFGDLSDVNSALITMDKKCFALILFGGDASEAYEAIIRFGPDQVHSRTLIALEGHQIFEQSTYPVLTPLE